MLDFLYSFAIQLLVILVISIFGILYKKGCIKYLLRPIGRRRFRFPFEIDDDELEKFGASWRNRGVFAAYRSHLAGIWKLGIESAFSEEDYIERRREFHSNWSGHKRTIIDAMIEFGKRSGSNTRIMVVYEYARILAEARDDKSASRLLKPLEPVVRNNRQSLGNKLSAKLLDGIGEVARFTDGDSAAKQLYEEALSLDSANYFALKHLGTIYRISRDYPKAEWYFKRAARWWRGRTYHVFFSLGYLYHEWNQYGKAKRHYKKSEKLHKRQSRNPYYRLHVKFGYLATIDGEQEKASKHFKKVEKMLSRTKADDDFEKVSLFAARLLLSVKAGNARDAHKKIEWCQKYIQGQIGSMRNSVFYCVYSDLARILAERPEVFGNENLSLRVRIQLREILDSLHRRNLQFLRQTVLSNSIQKLSENQLLIVECKLNSGSESERAALDKCMPVFDEDFVDTNDPNHHYLLKIDLGPKPQHFADALQTMLDHSALKIRTIGENLLDQKEDFQPYSAVVSSQTDGLLAGNFGWDLGTSSGSKRVFSKHLIARDTGLRNRFFLNPAIGCTMRCPYCYLPHHGISCRGPVTVSPLRPRDYVALVRTHVDLGPEGTLLSIGSFTEPFLPGLQDLTLDLIKELLPLGNPIQVSTKTSPPTDKIQDLIRTVPDLLRDQVVFYLSTNDLHHPIQSELRNWLDFAADLNLVMYIKPFTHHTNDQLDRFVELGQQNEHVGFVVGSLYYGEKMKDLGNPETDPDYARQEEMRYPMPSLDEIDGYEHGNAAGFRDELWRRLGERTVHKTSSCALAEKLNIPDPLGNFDSPFCASNGCRSRQLCQR